MEKKSRQRQRPPSVEYWQGPSLQGRGGFLEESTPGFTSGRTAAKTQPRPRQEEVKEVCAPLPTLESQPCDGLLLLAGASWTFFFSHFSRFSHHRLMG